MEQQNFFSIFYFLLTVLSLLFTREVCMVFIFVEKTKMKTTHRKKKLLFKKGKLSMFERTYPIFQNDTHHNPLFRH